MLLNIDVRTTAYPKKWQRKLTARPRTSKRWERQNANAAATATAAPQMSAYPKGIALVPCIQRANGQAGMRRLCGDRTLAKRKASPRGNTFCRQTSLTDLHSAALWQYLFTANKLILQTAPNGFFCRRNTARIYSAASRQPVCQTQQSAAPLQSSISRRRPYKTKSPHSTHGEGDPTLACKTTRGKHCYPVRRGASVCAPPLWHKKRTCNGCRFSFYKSILAGIFDSRLREYRTYKTRFYLFINSAILEYIFSLSPLPVVFNLKRGKTLLK